MHEGDLNFFNLPSALGHLFDDRIRLPMGTLDGPLPM